MYVAIMLTSLVLGALDVQPPTGDGMDLQGVAPPTTSIPLQPELRSAIQRRQSYGGGAVRGVPASSVRGNSRSYNQSSVMPGSPTSESADNGQQYQWLPPTAAAPKSGAAMGGGQPSGFYGQSRLPYSPTHPQPGQARSYNSQQDAQLLQMRLQAAQQATSPTVQQPASKAFSGVQMNTGGSSAWMNLYRTGNNNGTIDNYTTLVRPQIDQRQANQRFGADINSLESLSRVQGFHLNQLNRDTHNLQGVKYQQYFMNYGDFYPGFYPNR